MNPSKIIYRWCLAGAVSVMALSLQTTQAQLIYSQDFSTDDSANWAVNYSDANGPANSAVNFNFDYSTVGIPPAPHSVGGNTKGLKMTPDYATGGGLLGAAAVPGVSVSPTNFSISDNFVMHADMWVNVNCTPYAAPGGLALSAHNGSSSSILYGCGYGTLATEAIVAGQVDCVWVGTCTDNGSSAQMRIYGSAKSTSYQDGQYQSTGTLTPGFPGDPFVYNNSTGSRYFYNNPDWVNIFPSVPVPLSVQIAQPNTTNNASLPGLIGFKWHDVSVQKIGDVIVYSIDNHIVATANTSSAGANAGPYLVFNAADINSSASTDPDYTNKNFVVFANLTVSNYNNIINVSAPTPTTSEATPGSPGVFTLTRSSAGVPLTVNYTLSGTATNGVQYQTVPLSVTFPSTALTADVNIVPIDDGISSPTTTVILTLQSGDGYAGAGSGIVNILDNDPTTIDISGNSQAYGRYDNTVAGTGNNDFMLFTLSRRGKLSTGSDLNVNLSYSGSAVGGTDFTPVSSVVMPDGATTATFTVSPVNNPSVTTNRTVVVSVASGSGYAAGNGPATGKVVPAAYPAAPVLLSDDLTSPADAPNWFITYGCGDPVNDATDYQVDFGMSLASAAGGISIPPPPSGNSSALHVTCNKDVDPGSAGAVNVYYTNLWLSGDFAVRFNMNIIEGQLGGTATEGAIFGINHGGIYSNWWYGSGPLAAQTWSSDGVWYYVTAQPGGTAAGDYQEFTGLGGTNDNTGWQRIAAQNAGSFTNVFKNNPGPFTALDASGNQTSGVPANGTPAFGYDASTWCDVEIKQINNVITMSINHTPIFNYTNTTTWTGGYLMLGYSDPYGTSIGSPEAGVYYSDLQVVALTHTAVTIDSIVVSGGNVVIKFTTTNGSDTTSSFTLQNAGTVGGAYGDVTPAANITSLGGNQFQATTPYHGGMQFYRIEHN